MSEPQVTLCMIVRDEERILERCLKSVEGYVDEIVVVDTGSVDSTPEIAARFGAKVVHTVWNDDFSEARNAALDVAAGRYILALDADEWIESGPSAARLQKILGESAGEALSVEIADRLDGGGMHQYPLVRLFRNRPEHRYEGAFHEQITPAIARTIGREFVPDRPSGLVIGHDGYLEGRRTNRSKGERNLELLRRRVEKEPGDPAARYFLARERIPFRGGRAVPGTHLEEALHHLGNLDHDRLSPPLRFDAARLQAAALLAGRMSREAQQVLDECPDRGTGCELLRADAEMMIAESAGEGMQAALERIRRCFDRETCDLGPFSDPSLAGPIARARAAEALTALGRLDEARSLAREAAELEGGGATPWNALAAVERAAGNFSDAIKAYMRGLQADEIDPWAWAGVGELVLAAGDPEAAISPLENALALAPGWATIEESLEDALLLAGKIPQN